tara:strand:- start:1530 stop:1772 length:243 start_codon:yes stop_codon:yes gene_type:complete
MTPREFKAARNALGLSINELSFVLDIQERTIRKWEAERDPRPVNPLAVQVMGWLTLDNYEPPRLRWLLAGRKPDEWKEGE